MLVHFNLSIPETPVLLDNAFLYFKLGSLCYFVMTTLEDYFWSNEKRNGKSHMLHYSTRSSNKDQNKKKITKRRIVNGNFLWCFVVSKEILD